MVKKVALIGDRKEKINHANIEKCFAWAQKNQLDIRYEWLSTNKLCLNHIESFDGVWLTPGGPYQNDEAVLALISHMRQRETRPFLANCSGFQYSLMEYLRNACGVQDATTEELDPLSPHCVISKLSCSLSGNLAQALHLPEDSILKSIYGTSDIKARYNCNFSLNPLYQSYFKASADWKVAATHCDEIRALELTNKRFYLITLFQPAMDWADYDDLNPIVASFFHAL
ncbi:hypothetical protein ACFFIF_10820 [Vagococcus entomophilus]|uniref:CTP synthase (glutamine hydrolyzing) n=1 Tax=Vagococcus entomophilus TaxID=1160095 RepID=A0A430AEZ1_9ENTE|nr:hypothetical protein [Vagococcus entomophilus]RSU06182.1 hypothetical protein CBF30_10725 [Vagococcus entomophilus]